MVTATEAAANSETRAPGRPFPPGVSGNPDGRPKKDKQFAQFVQQYLEEHDEVEHQPRNIVLLKALYEEGKKGNVVAAREVLDRGYGKPVQRHEVTLDEARDVARRVAAEMGLEPEEVVRMAEAIVRGESISVGA